MTDPVGRFARLLRLQVLYALFATLHWALAYRFMVAEVGFSAVQAVWVAGVVYLSAVVLMLALPAFECRAALRVGFAFRIVTILPYAFWPTTTGIFLGSVAFGVALVLFWVPYNIMFFEHRTRTQAAGMSATYAAVAPFVDVGATLLAGFVAVRYGYGHLFGLASLLGLVPLYVAFRLRPRDVMRVDLRGRLGRLKGLRSIMFVNGVGQGVMWPAVPIVTLFYIQGTFAYASFFAILGLMGAIAAVMLGKLSDRRARRVMFLLPFALIFGMANLLSAVATNLAQWGVWRGVANLSNALFDPFKNAVLLDQAGDVVDLYVGREFLLNVGRVLGVAILTVATHLGQMQFALIVPGLTGLVVPFIIDAKELYPEERLVLKAFRNPWRQ